MLPLGWDGRVASNDDDEVLTGVVCRDGTQALWSAQVPGAACALVSGHGFVAVASVAGYLQVMLASSGLLALPLVRLDAPVAFLCARNAFLLAALCDGRVLVWNVRERVCTVRASVASLLRGPRTATEVQLDEGGLPAVYLSDGTALLWSEALQCWTVLAQRHIGLHARMGRRALQQQGGRLVSLQYPTLSSMRAPVQGLYERSKAEDLECLFVGNQLLLADMLGSQREGEHWAAELLITCAQLARQPALRDALASLSGATSLQPLHALGADGAWERIRARLRSMQSMPGIAQEALEEIEQVLAVRAPAAADGGSA